MPNRPQQTPINSNFYSQALIEETSTLKLFGEDAVSKRMRQKTSRRKLLFNFEEGAPLFKVFDDGVEEDATDADGHEDAEKFEAEERRQRSRDEDEPARLGQTRE